MLSAFTLVRVFPEKNVHVFERIARLTMIKEVVLVYGEYDVVVKTRTESIEELNEFIYNVLRKIPDIIGTTTLIVARMPEKKQSSAHAEE